MSHLQPCRRTGLFHRLRAALHTILLPAVLVGLIVVLLAGCRGEKGPGPDIIEQRKMMEVLADVARAEEYTVQRTGRDSSLNYTNELMLQYKRVFAKNSISRQQFFRSFNYYLSKPYLAKDMFDSLQAQLRRNAYARMTAPAIKN